MKKIIFLSILISSPAFSSTNWNQVIEGLYPTAQDGVNYKVCYVDYPNDPFICLWTIDKSTPTLNDSLTISYGLSTAKSTSDTQIQALETKLGLTDTQFQQLKAALK